MTDPFDADIFQEVDKLSDKKGIGQVHVDPALPVIVIPFDPAVISLEDALAMVNRALLGIKASQSSPDTTAGPRLRLYHESDQGEI